MATITNILNTNGKAVVLQSNGSTLSLGTSAVSTAITIGNLTGSSSTTINGVSVVIGVGATGLSIPAFTTTGALVSNTSGAITDATASTSGYVLTSNGSSSVPSFQAIPPTGMTWNDQTTSSVNMVTLNAYVMDAGASLITATLPTTAALGAEFRIVGKAAGLWTVAQNSGQSIVFGSSTTTTGVSGSLSSTLAADCIHLVCTTANNVFTVISSVGNLTVV
jgi:hypothetical protein